MPTDVAHPSPAQRAPSIVAIPWQRLVNGAFAVAIASGSFAFLEPAPYDVLILSALAIWCLGGFTVRPLVLVFAALMLCYVAGGFLALIPHLGEAEPTTFMVQSLYLALTSVLLAIFFAENTVARAEICLRAYALSCVVAGLGAIIGYFDLAGLGDSLTLYGRASSTFKDPNVLGSYLALGALYYMQTLMLGRTRHTILMSVGLIVILAGVFLSFSRGSWAVTTGGMAMVVSLTLLTASDARLRRRILLMILAVAILSALALAALMSIDTVREMFVQRFALVQDYDGGETGRFGNQLHAIPMLLDRVNGLGPLHFRQIFDEDPHSSYIGSFASYGWLGGASFLLLVGLTTYIGLRQVFAASPFRRLAQVFWPCLFLLMLQAFQIDIDHWRHVYLLLGAVWGIETARIRWMRAQESSRAHRPARV